MNTEPTKKFNTYLTYDELARKYQSFQETYAHLRLQKDLNMISRASFEELLFEYHRKQIYILELVKKFESTKVKNRQEDNYGRPPQPVEIIAYKDWIIKSDPRFTVAYSPQETIYCFKSNESKLLIEKETFLTWAFLRYKFAYRNMEEKNNILDVNGLHIQFSKMLDREYIKNFSLLDQTFELDDDLL